MAKLKFQPNPTFELHLSVPIWGQIENEDITVTVKHLPESEYLKLFDDKGTVEYVGFAHKMVVGWDMDKEFNTENLNEVLDNYPQVQKLIFAKYEEERYRIFLKN